MNRFKFRLWKKDYRKRYHMPEEIAFTLQSLMDIEEDFLETSVPEACTGHKDKNGKLIYEGDILLHTRWGYDSVKYSPDRGTFLYWGNDYLFDYDSSAIEIVGNIHENPELLEEA